MFDLKGKTILVTGGGGVGVGAGVCEAITRAGGTLLLNDIDEKSACDGAARYDGAVPAPGDITTAEGLEKIFFLVDEHCDRLDGLVNNAGIGMARIFHDMSPEDFDHLLNTDAKAVWSLSAHFAKGILTSARPDGGSIVNISSVHAHSTIPRWAVYAGAKGFVEGFTRGMASELGRHSIRCNAVAPGYVHSKQNLELFKPLIPDPARWVERFIQKHQALPHEIEPLDVGWLVAFLLSDISNKITGQTIRVDAGSTALLCDRDLMDPE